MDCKQRAMAKNLVRSFILLGLAVTTAACQSFVQNQLKTISAGHTGCTPEQISISNFHADTFGGGEVWNATCNGKVYICSGVAGKASGDYSCAPAAN
jgi:hypothetical protein